MTGAAWLALSLALSSASSSESAARVAFDEGRAHYEMGRFDEARAAFERAWSHERLPAFLFNIGQCHFQERHFDQAIFFYERYLELAPRAPNRALVRDLIREARAQLPAPTLAERAYDPWLWGGVAAGVVVGALGTAFAWSVWER